MTNSHTLTAPRRTPYVASAAALLLLVTGGFRGDTAFAQEQRPILRNIAGPGDYLLRQDLVRRLGRDPDLARESISVVLVNGGVVFSGPISSCALKLRALRMASHSRGVFNVTDEMSVVRADLPDEALRDAVEGLLSEASEELGLEELEVAVSDAVATLSGKVRDFRSRVEAAVRAASVLGVVGVTNRLMPGDAPSGTDDASIARAVGDYLEDFRAYPYVPELKVSVQDGVVTLGGRVGLLMARRHAEVMVGLVGGVEGVENRIKVDPSLYRKRISVEVLR